MGTVLFDLDGTLVESLPAMQAAGNRLLAELGRPPIDRDTYAAFVGQGMRAQLRKLVNHSGGLHGQDEDELLDRLNRIYAADPISGTVVIPNAKAALSQIRQQGHSLGLVTQKPTAPTMILLDALGLSGVFAAITCGDTYNFLKPDPRMIQMTATGTGPVIYVGDSMTDNETAEAAGVPFILREGGYGDQSVPVPAAACFRDFVELPRLIDKYMP